MMLSMRKAEVGDIDALCDLSHGKREWDVI